MPKSSPKHKCLPESKGFLSFRGPKHPQFNPAIQVKDQYEPKGKEPMTRHQNQARC